MEKVTYPPKSWWPQLLDRSAPTMVNLEKMVDIVFEAIKISGDKAITTYTEHFDKVRLTDFLVKQKEIEEAIAETPEDLKKTIEQAKANIEAFHRAQKTPKMAIETQPGVLCWQEKRPVQKVGLYIPGSTVRLFSTVLMLAIPAKIAGCEDIVLYTSPNVQGRIPSPILYTASLCGITRIFKVGGVQAIGAMTFGTKTLPKVDKIFGPGNSYVALAKQKATKYGVAIDLPAGPNELLIAADNTATPAFVAADLLSQAEYGLNSQVILVSTSKQFISFVEREIRQQLRTLPRAALARKALANSKLILVKNDQIAVELINAYAPEHLMLCVEDRAFYKQNLKNAGSVSMGNYTPKSAGHYASGVNQVLPTNGYAKQYSGVTLDSFMKTITFQRITKQGIARLGPIIQRMAEAEGLEGHKNAVTLRLR